MCALNWSRVFTTGGQKKGVTTYKDEVKNQTNEMGYCGNSQFFMTSKN